jgi:hypothetical protein
MVEVKSFPHALRPTELSVDVYYHIQEECRCANLCAGSTSEATVYLGSDRMGEFERNAVSVHNVIGLQGVVSTVVKPLPEGSGFHPSARLLRARDCAQGLGALHKGCSLLIRAGTQSRSVQIRSARLPTLEQLVTMHHLFDATSASVFVAGTRRKYKSAPCLN